MDRAQQMRSASGDAEYVLPMIPPLQTHDLGMLEENVASSDEEDVFVGAGEDAQDTASVIGVTISKTQGRLKSPKTPAVEKMAAMDDRGGFFGEPFDIVPSPEEQQPDTITPEPQDQVQVDSAPVEPVQKENKSSASKSPPPVLPSPWRAGPKTFERSGETSGILGSAFRKRSSSANERKLRLPIQLPSLPKSPRIFGSAHEDDTSGKLNARRKNSSSQDLNQFDGAASRREPWTQFIARARGLSITSDRPSGQSWSSTPSNSTPHPESPPVPQVIAESDPQSSRPKLGLRRATSDQSLYLARTLSKASSLGDDSRFEHVHEQINSRLKAIRDSWQDSNLRRNLPTLPNLPNLPNLPKAPSVFGGSRTDLSDRAEKSRGSGSGSLGRRSLMHSTIDVTQEASTSPDWGGGLKSSIAPSKGPKVAGMSSVNAAAHPYFTEALDNLTGDIIVLGGYRGSILREAQAPHRRLWVPLKVGFNLRKVDLEVGFEQDDEERVTDKIIPDGMLTHIGPVDISKRLFKRLRACENAQKGLLRVHDYGYDWRLNPHYLSGQLIQFLEQLQCNSQSSEGHHRGATVIAHSLGGLITRHAVNRRPDLFKGVVFAGVPETCVNILGPLRNGDDVLFSSKVLTAQVNLSIRTSIVLLPLNGRCFVDKNTKEEYPVDFYDVDDWIKYRWSPCTDPALPVSTATTKANTSLIGSVSSMLPDSLTSAMPSMSSIPFVNRRDSNPARGNTSDHKDVREAAVSHKKAQRADAHAEVVPNAGVALSMGSGSNSSSGPRKQEISNPATGITIPREKAIKYLTHLLPEMRRFREELAHNATHQSRNAYPPFAVMYGKTEPTVCGARVRGREGIAQVDAYDDLVFASGDGVVLARAAQLPNGYRAAKGGVVASERGHVTLLGDLEAVGKCLSALHKGRMKGVGLGHGQKAI